MKVRGCKPTPPHVRVMRRSNYEDRGHDSLCLIFKGALNQGYGQVCIGSKIDGSMRTIAAHKAVYEFFHGPVPAGMELDHLCRQRACCEVTHLEAVTHSENIRRTWPFREYVYGKRGYSERRYEPKTHCVHGHEYTLENTRLRANGRRACRTCVNRHNREYRKRRSLA